MVGDLLGVKSQRREDGEGDEGWTPATGQLFRYRNRRNAKSDVLLHYRRFAPTFPRSVLSWNMSLPLSEKVLMTFIAILPLLLFLVAKLRDRVKASKQKEEEY